jgi:hypothetical protein
MYLLPSDGVTRKDGLARKCRLVFVLGHKTATVSHNRYNLPVFIRKLIRLYETVAVFHLVYRQPLKREPRKMRGATLSARPFAPLFQVVPDALSQRWVTCKRLPLSQKCSKKD